MGKRSDKTANEIQRLRTLRAEFDQKRQAILADERYSAQYKHQLLDDLAASESAAAKAVASDAWKQVERDQTALTTEMQRLHSSHMAGYDFAALNYQTQRLRALISAPANALTGDSPAARLRARYDEAVKMGDVNQQRAIRALGLELLADAKPGGSTDEMRARDLYLQLEADELNDQPAGMAELKADADALAFNQRLLRGEIRQTETALTGATSDTALSMPTPWESDVLGETAESRGGGVRWKQPAGKPTDPIGGPDQAA